MDGTADMKGLESEGLADRIDRVSKSVGRLIPKPRPGTGEQRRKTIKRAEDGSQGRLLEMNDVEAQRWLRATLPLANKRKEEVIELLAEFMPSGHMLATMTEEQLRYEVEILYTNTLYTILYI